MAEEREWFIVGPAPTDTVIVGCVKCDAGILVTTRQQDRRWLCSKCAQEPFPVAVTEDA